MVRDRPLPGLDGARAAAHLRAAWPLLVLLAVVSGVVALSALGPIVLERRVTEALIKMLAVIALYIFVGNSGVMSFGHVAFMAIGAYVSALLTMKPAAKAIFLPALPDLLKAAEWPTLPAAIAGGAGAAIAAYLVGIPLMRLSGIAAGIATFAVLSIVYVGFGNWTTVTGGQGSLIGLPVYVDLWVALAWVLAAMTVAFLYQESRMGLALRASREDEIAAEASAVDVRRQRLVAFVLSAFFSGVSGVLLGHFLGTLRIDSFYLDLTFLLIAMLVIGGSGSLAGAVAGAFAISATAELLRQLEAGIAVAGVTVAAPAGIGDIVLALAMLLIIIFRPKGLTNGREIPPPSGLGPGWRSTSTLNRATTTAEQR